MKYNIFDFDQELAISLIKEEVDEKGKSIIYKLDVVDLLLLHTIADYMNRKSIEKMIINDKIYFWISYNMIIKDLPIIDIKKQALSDRLNKLVKLNLLEKEIVRNSQGTYSCFRIGDEYEILKYKGVCSKLQEGGVLDYEPKDYTINNNNNKNNKKEIDTKVSKESAIITDWKKDYNLYKDLVDKANKDLKSDMQFKANQEKFYLNINYEYTIDKCCEYWLSEEGYANCKKIKGNINMLSRLKKTFHMNKVYYPKGQKREEPIKVVENALLKTMNSEGELSDGTRVINGYRQYYSGRWCRVINIPLEAPEKPRSRTIEYDKDLKDWYEP